jgi:hypothetical protein
MNGYLPNLVTLATASSLHEQNGATLRHENADALLELQGRRLLCELNFSSCVLKAFLKFWTLKCREWSE